jgi:hypothetical protein
MSYYNIDHINGDYTGYLNHIATLFEGNELLRDKTFTPILSLFSNKLTAEILECTMPCFNAIRSLHLKYMKPILIQGMQGDINANNPDILKYAVAKALANIEING